MRILHVSDFHLDGKPGPLELLADAYYEGYITKLAEAVKIDPIDALCITGDFIHQHDTDGFLQAEKVVVYLQKTFHVDKECTFVCPGNHDFEWSAGRRTDESVKAYQDFAKRVAAREVNSGPSAAAVQWHRVSDDLAVVSIDALAGSSEHSAPPALHDAGIENVLMTIKRRKPREVIVLTHYVPIVPFTDIGRVEEEGFDRHTLAPAGDRFFQRLVRSISRETRILWLGGDIHRPFFFRPLPGISLWISGAGRLGGKTEKGYRPSCTLLTTSKSKSPQEKLFVWNVSGHQLGEFGVWATEKVPSPRRAAPRAIGERGRSKVEIDEDAELTIHNEIVRRRLLASGRFPAVAQNAATLLWLRSDELFGGDRAILDRIVAAFVEQLRQRFPNQDQILLIGLDAFGALIASLISPTLAAPAVCVATSGDAGRGTLISHVDTRIFGNAHRQQVIIIEDVVRSGTSAVKVVEECKRVFATSETPSKHRFFLASVVMNKQLIEALNGSHRDRDQSNEALMSATKSLADSYDGFWTCCGDINFMLFGISYWPDVVYWPETRAL